MAQTVTISTKELARLAAEAYESKTLKVMLCTVGASGYTAESTVANWQSVEKSGNGYLRFTTTIGTGSYNAGNGAYLLPLIDASFTASGVGYTYDTVVTYIDGATHPHSVITESPAIALSPGQTQLYRISLRTDD